MKKISVLALIVGMIFMVGCAGQFPQTSEGTYAQSLTLFNDGVEGYLVVLTAQKPEVKAAWKENINPYIHAASDALDIWAKAIGTELEMDKHLIYVQLWRDLFPMLINLGVIKVEE